MVQRHMNGGVGTEAAQFLFRANINSIFVTLWLRIGPEEVRIRELLG
jgi:hypothetical protein